MGNSRDPSLDHGLSEVFKPEKHSHTIIVKVFVKLRQRDRAGREDVWSRNACVYEGV